MTTRDQTKVVRIGDVTIGGGNPVAIQSMTNTDTRNVESTVAQIHRLAEAGCDIVRVAVPDMEAAEAISSIKKAIRLPLVADIHFDYRLALESIRRGADKIRINPGNIDTAELGSVTEVARVSGIPIRVGVNGGSLEKDILARDGGVTAKGLAESALRNVGLMEKLGFYDIVVSVKVSRVKDMLEAHRLVAEQIQYPLHVGLTEAGTPVGGAIRSAAGLGALLAMGVGDTVRVSLSGDPVEEVRVAKLILSAMGIRLFGVTVLACPTCGRTGIDVVGLAASIEERLAALDVPLTVAVMGCVVNGPGEAREADIGIAGGKGSGVLFKKGKVIETINENEMFGRIISEIESLA